MSAKRLGFKRLVYLARNENGGTLAELAILFPFLVIMLAAVSEFGRYFQNYTTLSKGTRTAARYLSKNDYNDPNVIAATKNLVVCGKLACTGGDELVQGMTTAKVCVESAGNATIPIETVTVRIPHVTGTCGAPHVYQPIFDISGLLGIPSFTFALPISPSNTMYYMFE